MDNQRSDGPERCTAFVVPELRRLDIDIAALQETRLADEGQLTEVGGGYTFYWIGKDATAHWLYGVCFAVKNELVKNMDNLSVGISERLMTLQINIEKKTESRIRSNFALLLMVQCRRSQLLTRLLYLEISMLEWVLTVKHGREQLARMVLARLMQMV